MIYRAVRFLAALSMMVALLLPLADACGPDFTGPIFTPVNGPDTADYAEYVHGNLGILQPSYWHRPLYIAYRHLNGQPFSASERKALTEPEPQDTAATDWVDAWKQARKKVDAQASDSQMYNMGHGVTRQLGQPDTFVEYYNCLDNAFENAVNILNKRVAQFGAQSLAVKDWLAAQDQVFENCAGVPGDPAKPKSAVIPAAARAEDPQEIRADRAYQIAAAHFYANDFDAAQARFEAIAQDPASPYNKLAAYLAARVLIRKGTLYGGSGPDGKQALARAETQLRAILADQNLSELHRGALRLLGFVQIRLHSERRFQELENSLSLGGDAKTFRQDLTDYLWLLDRESLTRAKTAGANSPAPPADRSAARETAMNQSADMTDWIFAFQSGLYPDALGRWKNTKSLPWLVAAIAKAPASDPAVAELTAAVAKVTPESPAYVTLNFHRLRLLERTDDPAARSQVDQFLARHAASLPLSAKNVFLALRARLAANLEDFLRFAPRTTREFPDVNNDATHQTPKDVPHFDVDASVILTERLPLRLLANAAKSQTLPVELRRDVTIAAWTRAIVLNNDAVALELTPRLEELVPEITEDLAAFTTAADPGERQFVTVFAILRNPGFRPFVSAGYPRGNLYTVGEPGFNKIDNLRDNWWCSAAPAARENPFFEQDYYRMFAQLSSALGPVYPEGKVSSPAFLTPEQRAEAEQEHAALAAQPSAPNWLGKRALEFANAHPDDPRVPEALYLTVRARRYGCADNTADNFSKLAFGLLHKRYANNPWTQKTPYWFE
jgi:hypothetical protein